MDSVTTQKTKSRKIKRLARKSRVQIILDLFFRAIEIFLVLVTVAKLCYELVITFQDSGVAAVILANRSVAFVVGNAIVIALISRSGLFSNQELDSKCKSNDLYEEFVLESSRRDVISRAQMRNREKQSEAENKAKQSITENRAKENEEKQIITESRVEQSVTEKRLKQSNPKKLTKQSISEKGDKESEVEHQEITVKMDKHNLTEKRQSQSYQRSRSENLEDLSKRSSGRLRRSETDASFERFDSDDELRHKIESFIARQRRNQNDE